MTVGFHLPPISWTEGRSDSKDMTAYRTVARKEEPPMRDTASCVHPLRVTVTFLLAGVYAPKWWQRRDVYAFLIIYTPNKTATSTRVLPKVYDRDSVCQTCEWSKHVEESASLRLASPKGLPSCLVSPKGDTVLKTFVSSYDVGESSIPLTEWGKHWKLSVPPCQKATKPLSIKENPATETLSAP